MYVKKKIKNIDIICMYIYIYYGRIYCTQNLIWEINEALGYLLKIIYDIIIIADTVYSKNTYIIIYIFWGHEIIYYIWVWSPPVYPLHIDAMGNI